MSLNAAADEGNLERVMRLVDQGVDKNRRSKTGKTTSLGIAAKKSHLAVVKYLVEQGADMEKADRGGCTPLMNASLRGHFEVVSYLLEQGATSDKADRWGETSLHCAADYGHLEATKLLMVYGADLNARDRRGLLPIDMHGATEEIRQAIRDEHERRIDLQPRKRCIEEERHPSAATSASAQQEGDEVGGKLEGTVADEDQDSEPSDDEEDN